MTDHNHNHDHEEHDETDYITIVDENGNEDLFEILFSFESEDYGKSYVFIFPAGTADDEEVELQAYSYTENETGKEGDLEPIESEEEWDMVEEVLNTFMQDENL